MKKRALVAVAIVALGAVVARAIALSSPAQDGFPHKDHAGLFPTCVGCHAGVEAGDEPGYYSVTALDCLECHDGTREREVDWRQPSRRITNLEFSHADHMAEVAETGDTTLECGGCHRIPGEEHRMAVAGATPEACIDCHAHAASEHLAGDAVCGTCHVPLAKALELPIQRMAEFPQPTMHERDDFLEAHADLAREEPPVAESCAVCHARESCTRCHLNATRIPEIVALPTDARIAQLVAGVAAEWPEPESHERPEWLVEHGADASKSIGSCANCHAEASCRTCHGAARIPVLAELPSPRPSEPGGVVIEAGRPPGHVLDFATRHGSAVAAELPNCGSCHVDRECAACHEQPLPLFGESDHEDESARRAGAPERSTEEAVDRDSSVWRAFVEASARDRRPGYHPANFVLRHGAEAFSAQAVCSDCHSSEAFCRGCHQGAGFGLGAGAGAGGAFHDTQPNWIIGHGQAARQGMEGCASCHRQSSCLRCHSARFGLRINPHGPDFDAGRAADRSTMSCGICHFAAQLPP